MFIHLSQKLNTFYVNYFASKKTLFLFAQQLNFVRNSFRNEKVK